jgi:hypothetical protein
MNFQAADNTIDYFVVFTIIIVLMWKRCVPEETVWVSIARQFTVERRHIYLYNGYMTMGKKNTSDQGCPVLSRGTADEEALPQGTPPATHLKGFKRQH